MRLASSINFQFKVIRNSAQRSVTRFQSSSNARDVSSVGVDLGNKTHPHWHHSIFSQRRIANILRGWMEIPYPSKEPCELAKRTVTCNLFEVSLCQKRRILFIIVIGTFKDDSPSRLTTSLATIGRCSPACSSRKSEIVRPRHAESSSTA